jgi:hypothetical protein
MWQELAFPTSEFFMKIWGSEDFMNGDFLLNIFTCMELLQMASGLVTGFFRILAKSNYNDDYVLTPLLNIQFTSASS